MKALQPSSQNMASSPKLYREPPNESSAVAWKSGSSGRGSIPSHPNTSTTTSGGDGGSAILQQQLEWNNNWNETQQIPKKQTFYPTSTFNFCLQPIILPLHSQLQLFPTRKILLFFHERPCCDKTQQNGRKKERKK